MGKALVKAGATEIATIVQRWAQDHKHTIAKTHFTIVDVSDNSPPSHFQTKGLFFAATCQLQPANDAVAVSMTLKLRLHLSVILNIILIIGLWLATVTMQNAIDDFNASTILNFGFWAIFVMLAIWCKETKLALKLTKLESSFWTLVADSYDTRMVTHVGGQVNTRCSEFLTAVVGSCWVIYICTMFLGISGFLISFIICLFLLVGCIFKYMRNNNPHWDWRFWIIENMSSWIVVTLTVLAFALVLSALEFFLPLRMYEPKNLRIITKAIKRGHFRTISPSTSKALEKDCQKYFYELAEYDFLEEKNKTDSDNENMREVAIRKSTHYYCLHYLVITAIAVYLFSIRPLRSILKAQKAWHHEAGGGLSREPCIPYMPQAWRWATPVSLRALILLNWIVGGIINIIAVVFCIDSLSYLLKGQALLFDKTANLWSWVFAASKTFFGTTAGQKTGAVFIIIVSLPVLILFATFIRRGVLIVFLAMKILLRYFFHIKYQNTEIPPIENFVQKICSKYDIAEPMIILVNSQDIILRLREISFSNKTAIELSNGTIELLNQQELKAVIAHELGHIKQGLWKVSMLKLLSSLAMFPNYYLTLCIDWAKKEMDADQFALTVTKDAESLKQALIKISTAQIPYSILATDSNLGFFNKSVKVSLKIFSKKLHSAIISVKFFFGDGLFGYVHPYLSERLEAIETNSL